MPSKALIGVFGVTSCLPSASHPRTTMKANYLAVSLLAGLWLAAAGIAVAQDNKEPRKHSSGEPSIITRDYIQDELKLSDEQKQKLQKTSPEFRKVSDSQEKTWVFLQETLSAEQLKRFEQLELQHEGPPALLRPEIVKELQITSEQREQFMGLIQEMKKKLEPLLKDAKAAANPQAMEKMRLEALTLRQACQGKMEALLSDAQKEQWREKIGGPFDTLRHH